MVFFYFILRDNHFVGNKVKEENLIADSLKIAGPKPQDISIFLHKDHIKAPQQRPLSTPL